MSETPQIRDAASPRQLRVSSTSERRSRLPVTPQRFTNVQKLRAVSSPLTPSNSSVISSPFTPITNVYSSSPLANTPNSSASTKVDTPESLKQKSSVADATHNWRSRAKENGIKVTNSENNIDPRTPANGILPVSFLSTHRRSRQALFQSKHSDVTAFVSPKVARVPVEDANCSMPEISSSILSSSLLATPEPPNMLSGGFSLNTPSPQTSHAIVQKLRQRGSLTDPARTRRRETFGATPSERLFDIDENESNVRVMYTPYPQSFGSPLALNPGRASSTGTRSISTSSVPIRISLYDTDEEDEDVDQDDLSACMSPRARTGKLRPVKSVASFPIPTSRLASESDAQLTRVVEETPKGPSQSNTCSVCSLQSSIGLLSTLMPCMHLICSSCLTGAVNIVGEKDMSCAVCNQPVNDFKLLAPLKITAVDITKTEAVETKQEATMKLLPSAFEQNSPSADSGKKTSENAEVQAVSQRSFGGSKQFSTGNRSCDLAVLRIDNVPWDVTPPDLFSFFPAYKVVRGHVLLDAKGKTLSHAYVELAATDAPGALRSAQNKPLGRDKRRRAVTVTMSSQSELMRALFPSWRGTFDGSKPTLDGLDQVGVARALETGLVSLSELDSLITLMRNPKSHFLKIPSLPFYSLASILTKFPADRDSRVFWSAKLRDLLFEITYAAVEILVSRIGAEYHDQNLLDMLIRAGLLCLAFTEEQRSKFLNVGSYTPNHLIDSPAPNAASVCDSMASEEVHTPDDSASSASAISEYRGLKSSRVKRSQHVREHSYPRTPQMQPHITTPPGLITGVRMSPNMDMRLLYAMQSPQSPYDVLAREFGVEPDLVAALAQRLVMESPASVGLYHGSMM